MSASVSGRGYRSGPVKLNWDAQAQPSQNEEVKLLVKMAQKAGVTRGLGSLKIKAIIPEDQRQFLCRSESHFKGAEATNAGEEPGTPRARCILGLGPRNNPPPHPHPRYSSSLCESFPL